MTGMLQTLFTSPWLLTALFVGIIYIVYRLSNKQASPKMLVPPDTVLIFGVGRGLRTPSASPFPLKLETFCRMAKIPYMVDHRGRMSSKQKTPWMMYNGEAVADSQFCIEYLKEHRGLEENLENDLTAQQKASARAFRELTEENLYWTMCYETFVKDTSKLSQALPYGKLKLWMFHKTLGPLLRLEMWGHGIGRHSDAEMWSIALNDLQALSDFLGDKPFFLGDEPREVDCAVFGMLSQIVFHMKGTRHECHVRENLPNLVSYVERMKERFWPDWNERCKGLNYQDDEYQLYPVRSY